MAAWRYGDQFGRRRRRHLTMLAGGVVVGGVAVVAGPMMGLVSMGAVSPLMNLLNTGMALYRAKVIVRVPDPAGGTFGTRLADLPKVSLIAEGDELVMRLPASRVRVGLPGVPALPWYRYDRGESRELRGADAIRAAGAILPRMNQSGGSARAVQRAVTLLEDAPSIERLYATAAANARRGRALNAVSHALKSIPVEQRLALEMAAHEDVERRALEGELHVLEAAWRDAEEIAKIADDMFLPGSVDEDLARLKRARDSHGAGEEPS
jgi:hypothetical protein